MKSVRTRLYEGSGTNDNDLLFTTDKVIDYDGFMLMSSAGAVDVEVTLDGTNWSTSALSLQDFGATTSDPVVVTAANRVYGFAGRYMNVRVRQNGATGATAAMIAWKT